MEKAKTLLQLKKGETGKVLGLYFDLLLKDRLEDLGLIKDTEVTCVGESPRKDPRAYFFRGSIFAIRNSDANKILLEGNEKIDENYCIGGKSKCRKKYTI